MITSCLTLSICSIFITPLIQKIKQFNIKTKQFVNDEHLIDDDTFQSPREIKELNDSFNKMADAITKQMDMIKTNNRKNGNYSKSCHDLKRHSQDSLIYRRITRRGH